MLTLLLLSGCLYNRPLYEEYLLSFTDDDGDGYREFDGDCNDADEEVNPSIDEYCDGIDNNCNDIIDTDALDVHAYFQDLDGDHQGNSDIKRELCDRPTDCVDTDQDCNDADPDIWLGAPESCDDSADKNCDGRPGNLDADEDGVASCEDCDDEDKNRFPGNVEVCDELDNDCNDVVDDEATDALSWYPDADGDGFGRTEDLVRACERPADASPDPGDCDDRDEDSNPDADELCGDGADNDCDGTPNGCRPEGEWDVGVVLSNNEADNLRAARGLGDVNGDGYDDIVVGASRSTGTGAAWMMLGPIQADQLPSATGSLRITASSHTYFGTFLTGPADFNGDGVLDFAVSAEEDDSSGSVHLISTDQRGERDVSEVAFTNLSHDPGYQIFMYMAVVPDADNDGADDLLVGAPGVAAADFDEGAAYLFTSLQSGSFDYQDATATFSGELIGGQVGFGVFNLDLNQDGSADYVIGAPTDGRAGGGAGILHVFYSPTVGSFSVEDADLQVTGVAGDRLGISSVSTEDVDGDGSDDFWMSASGSTLGGAYAGAAYLMPGALAAGDARGQALAILVGEAENDYFGIALDTGDMNADGHVDLAVSAEGQDQAGAQAGKSYLFYGPFAGTVDASDASASYTGSAPGAYSGVCLVFGGDLNADGNQDLLVCEPNAAPSRISVLFGYSY